MTIDEIRLSQIEDTLDGLVKYDQVSDDDIKWMIQRIKDLEKERDMLESIIDDLKFEQQLKELPW